MPLTPAQAQTLAAAIAADPVLNAIPLGSDGDAAIAAAFNLAASPDFYVWRTNVPKSQVKDAINYTTFISRSQAERDAFTFMMSDNMINPSLPNIRTGVADIFSGSGAVPIAQRDALTAVFRRKATRAEKLFANTAAGNGAQATPANLVVEGNISGSDVALAREA